MHAYSITSSMIDILEKISDEKTIKKVDIIKLELSPVSSIEPESVKFYYEFFTKDNIVLKDAKIKFILSSVKIKCSNCNKYFKTKSFPAVCPYCSSQNIYKVDFDDLKIKQIIADVC